jgi:hypothetical protein
MKIEGVLLNSLTLFVKQLNRQLEAIYRKEFGIYYLFLLDITSHYYRYYPGFQISVLLDTSLAFRRPAYSNTPLLR